MAHDVRLVHLRQGRRHGPALPGRQPVQGVLRRMRDLAAAPAGAASARRSSAAGAVPVTLTGRPAPTGRSPAPGRAGVGGRPRARREGRRERLDLGGRGDLRGADEQPVGQGRVVGLERRRAGSRPGRRDPAGGDGRPGRPATRIANSLRYGPGWSRGDADAARAASSSAARAAPAAATSRSPCGPIVAR